MTIIASNVSSNLSKIYYSTIVSSINWSNEKSIDHINKSIFRNPIFYLNHLNHRVQNIMIETL